MATRVARASWFGLAPLAAVALVACGRNSFSLPDFGGGVTITGSGMMKKETRAVSGFSKVDLRGVGDVTVSQTGTEALVIEADDNLLEHISSNVVDGKLVLDLDDKVRNAKSIHYRVTAKDLSEIDLEGTGEITAHDIHGADFSVHLSGAGQVKLPTLTANSLTVVISGTGKVSSAGTVQSEDIAISGTGSFRGDDLVAKSAFVNVSGTGGAVVNASDTLHAKVSGPGDVKYIGDPEVTKTVSGPGSVRRK